jgi:hypothetical protein
MMRKRLTGMTVVVAAVIALGSCGGGGGGPTTPPVTTPPTPAVAITARGEGNLVIHPSLDASLSFALETPIRITETGGGTADWNFVRIQLFKNGRENERYELGADVIERAGYKKITARGNQLYTVVFRFNDEGFDDAFVTLGFADLKDGRQFTVNDVTGWTDVAISFTPLSVPPGGTVRLPGR